MRCGRVRLLPRASCFLHHASCILLQENRHRPVVVNFDEHVRAKDTGLHGDALRFQQFDQATDKQLGSFRGRGLVVTGAAAFARVAIQGELAIKSIMAGM